MGDAELTHPSIQLVINFFLSIYSTPDTARCWQGTAAASGLVEPEGKQVKARWEGGGSAAETEPGCLPWLWEVVREGFLETGT